jgi:hypothetical protein
MREINLMAPKISQHILFALAAFIIASPSAFALKFANQFVEFELPNKWNCALEGAEWVCQSTDETKKRDAIIVLAAKLKGEQDSLDKYQEYLTKPRSFKGPDGKPVTSDAKYAKLNTINGHPWVDSMHMASEIPNFYTRYLATVKQDIGVLVTYSINKNKYQEYLTQFEDMVKSLKVFRKSGGILANSNQSIFQQATLPGSFTQQTVFPEQQAALPTDAKKTAKKGDDTLNLIILGGVAVVAFIIWRKKKASGA